MVRPRPTVNVKYGTSFLWNVQYQVANVAAKTISPNAETKNTPQKNPNTFNAYICMRKREEESNDTVKKEIDRMASILGIYRKCKMIIKMKTTKNVLYLKVGNYGWTLNFFEIACSHFAYLWRSSKAEYSIR